MTCRKRRNDVKTAGVSLTRDELRRCLFTDRSGIRHYGPHALRHACATRLLAEGLSMKEIGDHLGRRKADTTRGPLLGESAARQPFPVRAETDRIGKASPNS
jgi:integrase